MNAGRPIELRGEGAEYELRTVLSTLKERGCSVLVVGEVPPRVYRTASRRLFGHPEERRQRVLLRLRQTISLEEWFPADVGLDDRGVRIVDCTHPDRTTTEEESGFGAARWHSKFDPAETPALTRRRDLDGCIEEIDAIAAEAGSLASTQLRVGAYSLGVLGGHDERIDVVSTVTSTVTAHEGMVHFHLQRPPTCEDVRTLLDHVDATITLRKPAPVAPPQHKWTVPEYGETPWIPLERYE